MQPGSTPGTAGRVENAQAGVFLAYAVPGRVPGADRPGAVPAGEMDRGPGPVPGGGIGDDVAFATKPELARQMIERAAKAGVPFAWASGDEVYGGNPKLREWLEGQQIPYVLAAASPDRYRPRPRPLAGQPRHPELSAGQGR